jgi:hypothetical protein
VLFGIAVIATQACGSVPVDDSRSDKRLYPPKGVIRGNVVFQGPHPCSQNGHIVGNAVVLVFDRRSPPPPVGLANTAVNFGVVTGDTLFPNEPRNPNAEVYCPKEHGIRDTITVTAPFTIAPLDPASYILQSFFDYTGDFLPTFKFRNLPELGDVGGGYIDTADAQKTGHLGNPNYLPTFIPVDVGIPDLASPPGPIPTFTMPSQGFVADGVTVSLGLVFPFTRPYFYPQGLGVDFDVNSPGTIGTHVVESADAPAKNLGGIGGTTESDPNFAPVLTMPQDLEVYALPKAVIESNVNNFESRLSHLRLEWSVPQTELPIATDPTKPFHFQSPPFAPTSAGGGLLVWADEAVDATGKGSGKPKQIPEGTVPKLWPLVVLSKLVDDPDHSYDPQSVLAQGSATQPIVILQAITLLGDDPATQRAESLFQTAFFPSSTYFAGVNTPVIFKQDHVTVLLRPSVVCFQSAADLLAGNGVLVTPNATGDRADLVNPEKGVPIVDPSVLVNSPDLKRLVKNVKFGCLPTGRYAINAVYPDGQAWTVPNEAGACAGKASTEGETNYDAKTCTLKPRDILYSQGTRAVVEIVAADPKSGHCQGGQAVPVECTVPAQ